jgi:hypothetical protein
MEILSYRPSNQLCRILHVSTKARQPRLPDLVALYSLKIAAELSQHLYGSPICEMDIKRLCFGFLPFLLQRYRESWLD